jgi:hypothetical protein
MCGKKEKLNSCTGCFRRQYCSTECQTKAWADHKPVCNAYKYVGREVTDLEQVARKLMECSVNLCSSNRLESALRVSTEVLALCKASKLDIDFTVAAMDHVSGTLRAMSRDQEAEIFAREMVAESEKVTPIRELHAIAVGRLTSVLLSQGKPEEARQMAHGAVERFLVRVPIGEAMMRLMELEATALGTLRRHEEALALKQHCLKGRLENPSKFQNGGKVPMSCYHAVAQSLVGIGRLDDAEAMLKQVLATLKSDGIEFHPDVLSVMEALGPIYQEQRRIPELGALIKAVQKLVPKVFPKDHPEYKRYLNL